MATPNTASYNKKSPTIKRILREATELANTPSPDYHAAPLDTNLFEWHFTLRGPPSSPYSKGIYHGRINLPPTYPLRPPSFRFLTPSGRFEVNREICLSISGHHEESWQPAWGVRTAVVALRAFMAGEAGGQLGGVECGADTRRQIAAESTSWECPDCGKCNEVILSESAKAAEEAGVEAEEETVPEEMKMGFKVKKEEEGNAQAAPVEPAGAPAGQVVADTPRIEEPLRAQPVRETERAEAPVRQEEVQDENFWIDRAIYALVALLFAILFKKFFGLEVF